MTAFLFFFPITVRLSGILRLNKSGAQRFERFLFRGGQFCHYPFLRLHMGWVYFPDDFLMILSMKIDGTTMHTEGKNEGNRLP
jgi:hypothetical protein